MLVFLMASTIQAQSKKSSPPNLLLFMADDCSYYDLGCYGSLDSKTPNIDKFASEGMRFTKGYQAAPMCSPTRHNLYTGIWPVRTGAYPNHTKANQDVKSIVHHLKAVGYRIALIGKSHVGPQSVFPFEYVPLMANNELNVTAIDTFMTSCKAQKKPFCLFVMSNQPHEPWNKGNPRLFDSQKIKLPPFYVDIPETRNNFVKYLAEINFMDQEFGTLLGTLEKNGLKDRTAVVFLSEQGNSLPFAKWTCYDSGVHAAIIVRWPGKVKPGVVSNAMVEYGDIVPTFLEMARTQPLAPVDGKSFVSVLTGKKIEHKLYTYSLQTSRGIGNGGEYYGIRSVADKKYRYIINLTPEAEFQNYTTHSPLFKKWLELAKTDTLAQQLTYRYQHRPAIELFDLEKDPYCLYNIASNPENKTVVTRMDKALKDWMAYCGDKGQATEMEALEHMNKSRKEE